MDKTDRIQEYIDKICEEIKWKSYRPAIRTEIQNHINDRIDDLNENGITGDVALKQTLEELGNPDMLGEQLNKVYQPEYNRSFIFVFYLFILIISFVEYFSLLKVTGNYLTIFHSFFGILAGTGLAVVLFRTDWSDSGKRNRFASRMFTGLVLLCILLSIVRFSDRIYILNGVFLLFPILFCLFIGRMKDKKWIGLVLSVLLFSIPVLVSFYVHSYAGMLILLISSWFILYFTLKNNWLQTGKKGLLYLIITIPYLGCMFYLANLKINQILLNMKGFFVQELIQTSILAGKGNSDLAGIHQIVDYPITFLTADYGYIMLIIYIFFFSILLFEIKKVYARQQSFQARLLTATILMDFIIEFIFSVLLNLGLPFVKGIAVPFLDFNFGIIIKIVQLGLVQMLDCFGNYIFNDYIPDKLFDIEDGKIIIYYK